MGDVTDINEMKQDREDFNTPCCDKISRHLYKIEKKVENPLSGSKITLVILSAMFLTQIAGFAFLYNGIVENRKKIHYRYFVTQEALEAIHNVKIENGKIIRDYRKK